MSPLFCSQSIFTAVAFYMKHLGVKTRAVDSKKSRGGFFKNRLAKVSVHWLQCPKEPFGVCLELFAAFELFLKPASILVLSE